MECWKKKVDQNCSMKVGDYSLNFQNYLNLLVSDMRKGERGERRGEKGQRTTNNGQRTEDKGNKEREQGRGIGGRYRVERGDERGEGRLTGILVQQIL